MELRHLRYFVMVAKELNFSRAAEKLYTAQPSLSQQIKDLEDYVGVQLFHRTKRKVELTEEGAVFLEQAQHTLAQADKAVQMARQVSKSKQQVLSIGFVPVAEMKIFPYVIPQLRVQHPDLKINLLSLNHAEQIEQLRAGKIDLALLRENIHDEDIQSHFVLRDPLVFLLPENHPLAHYKRIPLSELNGIDFVIPSALTSSPLHHTILNFAQKHNIHFNIVQEAENILFNINSIAMGLGCTILPEYIVPLTMKTVTRPIEVDLPYFDLYVSYRKNTDLITVKHFIQHLNQVFHLNPFQN